MKLDYKSLKQGTRLLHQFPEESEIELVIVSCDTTELVEYLFRHGGTEEQIEEYNGILYCLSEELYEETKDKAIEEKYNDTKRIELDIIKNFMPVTNHHAKAILQRLEDD